MPQYQIMVCNDCRYAVLPSQMDRHLASAKHRIPATRRRAIHDAIRAWPRLLQTEADLVQLQAPTDMPPHFEQLELYADGRKCHTCQHIMRTDEGIQKHCRIQHGWTNDWKRGGKIANRQRAGLSVNRPWTEGVYCQRFFTHGRRQEYFEVQAPRTASRAAQETAEAEEVLPPWEQGRIRLTQKWTAVQETARRMIQEGQADEINPWLERAGWQSYLVGLDRTRLVQCVSAPDEEEEPVNAAIWQIMDELIQYCQHSVIHRVGVFVRLEAIRTEKHQTRYQPLQPYMDAEGMAKYSRPWKQVLMFIARTQEAHDWESPVYQLTASQSQAWEILVGEAQKIAAQRDESDGGNDDDGSGRNGGGNRGGGNRGGNNRGSNRSSNRGNNRGNNRGSNNGGNSGRNSGRNSGSNNSRNNGSNGDNNDDPTPIMTDAHKACLQFCTELLHQRITRKEYDSALVCALAVLGVKSDGWMGPNQYPPILSAMIKISRFMVVQEALEYEQEEEEDPDSNKFVGCLNWVKRMMDGFMVRGSHSPMQ